MEKLLQLSSLKWEMKNSDLKKKKKGGVKNAYQNKRNIFKHAKKLSFHFFHIYFLKNGVEVTFEPTPILTMQSNEFTLYQLS